MPSRQPRLFDTYAGLFEALLGAKARFGFCDRRLEQLHTIGEPVSPDVLPWLQGFQIPSHHAGEPRVHTTRFETGQHGVALEMRDAKGRFLGALAIEIDAPVWERLGEWAPKVVATRIEPGLQVLHRELVAQSKLATRSGVIAERAQELEWLFGLSTRLTNNSGDDESLQSLLDAACERIGAAFGALVIPERRISLKVGAEQAPKLAKAFEQAGNHLLKWVQRSEKPLVVNTPAANAPRQLACRLLAVPIVQRTGRAIGVLVFLNSLRAPEFAARHLFLARHLGRQVAPILETQFDATTGLYTRAALERQFGKAGRGTGKAEGTVIYIDIDQLHVINDVHGFEIGDEVIVRIAELLGPPLLARSALAARVSGDRFAVVLEEVETDTAVTLAMAIQGAASQILIGPADQRTEISLSCGVAALVDVPQSLARALAAAELACKTAKDRGRGRVEVYAVADRSMMRRQDDVIAVGRLRAALQADRMVLYAQRITPLQDTARGVGYEILVRLRDEDGSIVAPGEFISAAQRYQLLPSIDRWVMERAFRQLAPFASVLVERGHIDLDQRVGSVHRRHRLHASLHRPARGVGPGPGHDHGGDDRTVVDRQPAECDRSGAAPAADGMPVRARRLRDRVEFAGLPEGLSGHARQDRRQLRARHPDQRPLGADRAGHRADGEGHVARDGGRVRREHGHRPQGPQPGRRVRAGVRLRQAGTPRGHPAGAPGRGNPARPPVRVRPVDSPTTLTPIRVLPR
jgi:diguanylate cyclase (GGDEF)-like protein